MIKKNPFLFFLLFIEGGALMSVELMGAKFIAPFYGGSLYVWTSVLAIAVLGLTLGYYTGGELAKKQTSLQLPVSILGVSAILVGIMPWTTKGLIWMTGGLGLIPGTVITCLLLLLPPLFCFGLIGPLLVRLMSSKLENLGKIVGTVYFTSTLGGIIATFLFGFYIIPIHGLIFSSTITGLALASIPIFYTVFQKGKEKSRDVDIVSPNLSVKSNLKPKEKKSKHSSFNVTSGIYFFAMLEGASVMAVELMAARMLAPYFGSGLYVWGAVIGVTLMSLAIGYFLGGVVADKFKPPLSLWWALLGASMLVMIQHFTSWHLTLFFKELDPIIAVVLISILFVLPPLILLGMVPTLLIRYLSAKVSDAGSVTGRVYTLSSASGILVLPILGFMIIPQFGLTNPSIIIGLLIGIIPFIRLLTNKKYVSLLFVLVIIISFSLRKKEQSSPDISILHYSEGLLGQVIVADVFKMETPDSMVNMNDRILFVNRMGQTQIDRTSYRSKWLYFTFTDAVASKLPEHSSALVLGLGGGSGANIFANLKYSVDAIELDERIAEVATKYFGLNKGVHVIVDDARHYIETTQKKYDLIFFDVFKGDIMPPHVLSVECFSKARTLLNPGGLIVVNFNGFLTGEIGLPGRSLYNTLIKAGLTTKILPTPGDEDHRNSLFVSSVEDQDFSVLRSPLQYQGKTVDMDSLFVDPHTLDLNYAAVFVDDRPVLDRINSKAAKAWRQGYNESFTKYFLEQGIPLFR
jgi:predicted membrane-bound spermidine synthase